MKENIWLTVDSISHRKQRHQLKQHARSLASKMAYLRIGRLLPIDGTLQNWNPD